MLGFNMANRSNKNQMVRLSPSDIVFNFVNNHFVRSSLDYQYSDDNNRLLEYLGVFSLTDRDAPEYSEELRKVSYYLNEISDELYDFIRENIYSTRFDEIIKTFLKANNLLANQDPEFENLYRKFQIVADSLFSEFNWYCVITFLTFGAEVACQLVREMRSRRRGDRKKTDDKVFLVLACMSRYIDLVLMEYIDSQEERWLSVREIFKPPQAVEPKKHFKSWGQYVGLGALVALAGGLYICSKISVQ